MKEFKPIILFIIKFFAVYVFLLIGYNKYLASYHSENRQDPFSRKVATWSATTAKILGFDAKSADDTLQPWTWIYIDGQKTSYINEGCNAISIMIIFAAFVAAFSTGWIITTIYVIAGWVIIQSMNILRIVLLNCIFRYYPAYGKAAHDYLFPVIIYGIVFLLWIIWVRKFVMKKGGKMNGWFRYVYSALLLTGLILVRKFEEVLFYDPFLGYFHGKIGKAYYPDYDLFRVILHVAFRYLLNSVLSVLLIWFIFFNKRYVQFAVYAHFVLFMLLLPVYAYLVIHYFEWGDNIGFYVRRFLIQPLLLLLLVPALAAYKPEK